MQLNKTIYNQIIEHLIKNNIPKTTYNPKRDTEHLKQLVSINLFNKNYLDLSYEYSYAVHSAIEDYTNS